MYSDFATLRLNLTVLLMFLQVGYQFSAQKTVGNFAHLACHADFPIFINFDSKVTTGHFYGEFALGQTAFYHYCCHSARRAARSQCPTGAAFPNHNLNFGGRNNFSKLHVDAIREHGVSFDLRSFSFKITQCGLPTDTQLI